MARTKSNTTATQSSATIGFEGKLWLTAWVQHFIHRLLP